ncbi:MAG TPA: hypothetical protein VHC40_00405 [Rhizomicrobium sp.]|nr:hypothetical protein [Rhizomicrobium sp.]
MVAIEYHHHYGRCRTPRQRWKAEHRGRRLARHAHDGRAAVWRWIFAGLVIFWTLVAYGLRAIV